MIKLITTDHQEIFDLSVVYFKEARSRCYMAGACRYITQTGQRCVIGNLLSLETWDDAVRLARYSGGVSATFFDLFRIPWNIQLGHLLADLQQIHDNGLNWNADGFIGWGDIFDLALQYQLRIDRVGIEVTR